MDVTETNNDGMFTDNETSGQRDKYKKGAMAIGD